MSNNSDENPKQQPEPKEKPNKEAEPKVSPIKYVKESYDPELDKHKSKNR